MVSLNSLEVRFSAEGTRITSIEELMGEKCKKSSRTEDNLYPISVQKIRGAPPGPPPHL